MNINQILNDYKEYIVYAGIVVPAAILFKDNNIGGLNEYLLSYVLALVGFYVFYQYYVNVKQSRPQFKQMHKPSVGREEWEKDELDRPRKVHSPPILDRGKIRR